MKLIDTVDNFLLGISESSHESYKKKIYVFYEFLTTEKNVPDNSFHTYLEAINIKEIEESLDFYITNYQINCKTIAWHYISVIKKYFDFLYKNDIRNNNLIKSFGLSRDNSESFQYIMNDKIMNDSRILIKDPMKELTWDEVNVLITECNQKISDLSKIEDLSRSEYNEFLSSIIIKLILFTGIPYRIIRDIEYNYSINTIHNTICINQFTIHLPNILSEQVSLYLKIRNNRVKNEDKLFTSYNGKKLIKQTTIIANSLNEFIGRRDVTGIIKFAIIGLIEKGVNQSIIQLFSEVGQTIYKYCQDSVNDRRKENSNRYLDSKLRSLDVYDIL